MTSPTDPIVGNQGLTYTSELGGGESDAAGPASGSETKNVTESNTTISLRADTTVLNLTGTGGSISRIEANEVDGHTIRLIWNTGASVNVSEFNDDGPNIIWRNSPGPTLGPYLAGTIMLLTYSEAMSKWFESSRTPYRGNPYTG